VIRPSQGAAGGEGVLRRLKEAGCTYRETLVECLGTGASVGGIVRRVPESDLIETVLRISVAADTPEPVKRFHAGDRATRHLRAAGVTGYARAARKSCRFFGYWPCLIARTAVKPVLANAMKTLRTNRVCAQRRQGLLGQHRRLRSHAADYAWLRQHLTAAPGRGLVQALALARSCARALPPPASTPAGDE